MEKKNPSNISRRNFLTGAGLTTALAAGSLLAGCGTQPAPNPEEPKAESIKWDKEADVIVVGGGGAGMSAALKASEAGCTVIVLEKGVRPGGSTALCGQAIMGVGTSVQKAAGIEDSVEEAMKYFEAVADGRDDLLRFVVERSGEAVDWLVGLGMEVPAKAGTPGLSCGGQEYTLAHITPPVMRTHWAVKPEPGLWPVLMKAVEADTNITVETKTPGTALVQDFTTGEILGVRSGEVTYKARKGVVLSAGGFARNEEMFHALVNRRTVHTTANPQDTGDGINMAIDVGAGSGYFGMLSTVDYVNPSLPCVFIVLGPDALKDKPPFILVNEQGERFSNERKFYSYVCEDLLKQTNARAFLVTCGENGFAGMTKAGEQAFKADTIEELAAAIQVDPAVLKNTVDTWNKQCADGVDTQFARTDALYPLPAAPYYAAEVKASNASTFGGVTVDTEMHVIRAIDGQPIPRLYAAGMNTMALGRFYPTCGTAVSAAISTGMQAGVSVAKETSL